jgi:tetratricopeptide (TPR) repeat protein
VILYVGIGVGAFFLLLLVWLLLGRGPRRRRAFRRAQRLLQEGSWLNALQLVEAIRQQGNLSTAWQDRLRELAGECHQEATNSALKDKRYEDALQHALTASSLLDLNEAELRTRVIDAMLAEVRRLFAAGIGPAETTAVLQLVQQTLAMQTPCPEASFWQGLCQLRQGNLDTALQTLTAVHEQVGKQFLDPAFYIGGLLHRLGRPQEGIRFLADANRVDASCPFVTWQMGISLVAAGGDSGLALRALQRALGPRGLEMWVKQPARVWVEAFPENRSYVRRLAARHPFVCPLLGNDLPAIIRQGQLALAQALYRQGNFQESADLYAKLMQDSPPTLPLLRGVGLSLARLQRYDQAYKHLRTAMELDGGKDPMTAGYLALCGAMGKPTNPDDRPKNVAWAIRLLARFELSGNIEWAGLNNTVYAEARSLGMTLSEEDQVQVCNLLASVDAVDVNAAAAYASLAATYPAAIIPRHAWLYCRAATLHGSKSPQDLDLFARTFREPGPARQYFAHMQWNFDDALYTYLERSAAVDPGRFPEPLGPNAQAEGETFLLERSRREDEANRKDVALACVGVLLQLHPASLPGHDRLACLHYRRGDLDQAVALLSGWHRLAPADHWPLVREAIIEQQRGNAERRAQVIDRALHLTRGPLRAAIAFLGAKLSLRECVKDWTRPAPLTQTLGLLEECLKDDPSHTDALWCVAAVRSVLGQREQLAAQAPRMNRPEVGDARFHYLGAVCHLAARDYAGVLELSQRAATDEALTADCHYLMAWAHLHLQNPAEATQALHKVAATEKGPAAVYARALLGRLSFARDAYDDAIKWWNQVDARRRSDWHLDDPLRQTVLLSGLLAFEKERYEQAADRFKEAGRLGLRDKRLGSLLTLALVKAGQRLLYEQTK